MENADYQVLSQLSQWIAAGETCWLCTVVKTWGSSPRPVGSLLCCNSTGEMAGSLSGGCVEDDLLEKLRQGALAHDKPAMLVYGATDEDQVRFNLPCGGQLHIIIEPFIDQRHLQSLQLIVSRLAARECTERLVDISTGDMQVSEQPRFKHLTFDGDCSQTDVPEGTTLAQTYGPRYQLFLIGAGQVSMYVANIARTLDYQVLVCDPRPEVLAQWPVEGVQLISDMPDDAVRRYANDSFSAIIALTHDPRIDDMGLMEALKTDAFFVGAMGSTRTSAKRRERLLQLELTSAEIDRLHAPVGLPIGSKTPAEIAVAILAQLTALRNQRDQNVVADFRPHLAVNP
jgi:xanthine dehydrogenase accessory factor